MTMSDKSVLLGAVVTLAFGPESVTTFGINAYQTGGGPPRFGSFGRTGPGPRSSGGSRESRPDIFYRDPFHEDYPPENHFFYNFDFMEGEVDNLDYMAEQEEMMFSNQSPEALYDRLRGVRPGPYPEGPGPQGPGIRTFDGEAPPMNQDDIPHPFRTTTREPATYSITRPDTKSSSVVSSPKSSDKSNSNTIESIRNREPAVQSIWDTTAPTVMDGNTMETWAFPTPDLERVQVLLKSSQAGCPLHATIDLWHGPENTPCKMAVYCLNEGGGFGQQPATFSAILETPRGQNTVAVKNIADAEEAPMMACVEAEMASGNMRSKKKNYQHDFSYHTRRPKKGSDDAVKPLKTITQKLVDSASKVDVQSEGEAGSGRNIHTITIPKDVASMQVMLSTEPLRPLQARIEVAVVEGAGGTFSSRSKKSSSIQQVCEVHSEDGDSRPLFAILDIPPLTSKSIQYEIRVVNLSTMDFPIKALVKPFAMREEGDMLDEEGSEFDMDKSSTDTVIDAEIVQ